MGVGFPHPAKNAGFRLSGRGHPAKNAGGTTFGRSSRPTADGVQIQAEGLTPFVDRPAFGGTFIETMFV